MTHRTTDEDAPPLSPEFLGRNFPVARSLRRENADLFAAFLPADQLKDDDAFYAALARMVACDTGIEALRAFDRRMKQAGDERKTFIMRARRWLLQQNPGLEPSARFARDADELLGNVEEAAVHLLFVQLAAQVGSSGRQDDTSPDGAEAAPPGTDWRAARHSPRYCAPTPT